MLELLLGPVPRKCADGSHWRFSLLGSFVGIAVSSIDPIPFCPQAALGGSIEAFRDYATNPVFSHLVNCRGWKLVSVGPVIEGTPTRGAMQTVLIDVVADPTDDPPRQFLWTLQRERRPPRQGCFLVHECIYVRNAYDLTL